MKKYIFVGLGAMMLSIAAYAKDEPVTIDGKHILVMDISESGFGNKQLNSSDLNGGVYIIVFSDTYSHRFPNAEKLVAERFRMKGFTIADSMDKAAITIAFQVIGAVNIARADQAAAYSAMPNAGQVATGAGGLIGASMNSAGRIAGGGVTGAVGYLAGALFETDSKVVIGATSMKKAVSFDGLFGIKSVKSSVSDGDHSHVAKVFYKLEKGKEASDDVVLKMATDEWIKHFVKFDSTSPTQEATALPAAPVATAPTDSSIQVMDEKK